MRSISANRSVALLRGVNVGGQRRVPMAELRRVAGDLGLVNPQTCAASGNLLFESDRPSDELEALLERVARRRFGFPIDVFVRRAREWERNLASNPFPGEARADPNWVWMFISKKPPRKQAAEEVMSRASYLRAAQTTQSLWIHLPNGPNMKILSIPWVSVIGSSATSRTANTCKRIAEMLKREPAAVCSHI